MNKQSVSRLSKYRAVILRFKELGFRKTYSSVLADAVGASAEQVRKDFSVFGICGNKKGGYLVEDILQRLNTIFIKDKEHKVVIAGAGNIGKALMNFNGFKKDGMNIVACFDVDPAKTQKKYAGIPVFSPEDLHGFVHSNTIRVGIICVPEYAAQHTADLMVKAGIRGILNFAPIKLSVPQECVVNNVSLEQELENVIYFSSVAEKEGRIV